MKHLAWLCSVAGWLWIGASGVAGEMPRVLDERMELSLVAREPDIVTPIGLTFDARGRLLVVESHTHFPLEGYTGPKGDRIRWLVDADGDGRSERVETFYEGCKHTMSIARGPADWIYVATRMRVMRIRDADDDGRADEEEEIARLETAGDYPHNGLCGLWLDDDEVLYFGLGENLGEDYALVGSDGVRLTGGGEGGSVFCCGMDGGGLQRVATGVWNPFGLCVDPHGRLFAVDNDPDASPPCRLLHVVEGGDYGYQFRYGRAGKHPLQAWDGELPGTLPMVAGTSEAPSAVLPYHGRLYVTSWGENRIERFALQSRGASFDAVREVVVQGDNQFRPVDFAVADDGSLYFSDWVDRSYNVHGQGRVWRLRWKENSERGEFAPPTDEERKGVRFSSVAEVANLCQDDPFLWQAAVEGLVDSVVVHEVELGELGDVRQALGVLKGARESAISTRRRDELLREGLDSPWMEVRMYVVRWVADEGLVEFRDELAGILSDDRVEWPLFRATLAALDWLDTRQTPARGGLAAGEAWLLEAVEDDGRPEALRAQALRMLGTEHPQLTAEWLWKLIDENHGALQREAVRTLVLTSSIEDRTSALLQLAGDETLQSAARADAVAGLGGSSELHAALEGLAGVGPADVQQAARRAMARGSSGEGADEFPAVGDMEEWLDRLGGEGDADAGWRVFFGAGNVRCADCHAWNGQGADVGPDLTGIVARAGRRRVVESLLQPSREIAPRYVPWVIETTDGRVLSGLSLGVPGSGPVEQFLGNDGRVFEIPREQIAARTLSDTSIMPEGIHQRFTLDELRDLLRLLSQE